MHSLILPNDIQTLQDVRTETIDIQDIQLNPTPEQIEAINDICAPDIAINGNGRHLSPLRYPGGKSWLMPTVRQWLRFYSTENQNLTLVEPFLGGGIVSLTALNERLCRQVASSEIDPDIAAVWKTMLGRKNKWLANRIVGFEFNIETINQVLNTPIKRVHQAAFKTILRNRISRGGILAPGAGLLKQGESSKGISSRWYAQTIADRIKAIHRHQENFGFKQGDGMRLINKWINNQNSIFFIDPPYPEVGSRLYTYHELNHDKLFKKMSLTQSPFLMTYNDVLEVRRLANKYSFHCIEIEMTNTHHEQRTELLITNSTQWM